MTIGPSAGIRFRSTASSRSEIDCLSRSYSSPRYRAARRSAIRAPVGAEHAAQHWIAGHPVEHLFGLRQRQRSRGAASAAAHQVAAKAAVERGFAMTTVGAPARQAAEQRPVTPGAMRPVARSDLDAPTHGSRAKFGAPERILSDRSVLCSLFFVVVTSGFPVLDWSITTTPLFFVICLCVGDCRVGDRCVGDSCVGDSCVGDSPVRRARVGDSPADGRASVTVKPQTSWMPRATVGLWLRRWHRGWVERLG